MRSFPPRPDAGTGQDGGVSPGSLHQEADMASGCNEHYFRHIYFSDLSLEADKDKLREDKS